MALLFARLKGWNHDVIEPLRLSGIIARLYSPPLSIVPYQLEHAQPRGSPILDVIPFKQPRSYVKMSQKKVWGGDRPPRLHQWIRPWYWSMKLVITKGYGVRATTIEGQNAFAPRCALRKFHVTDSQNTRDQITSGRKSKRAWSNCALCIPFTLSGRPNECWLHTCDACVITSWRLGLRTPLVARNNAKLQYLATLALSMFANIIVVDNFSDV